MCVEKLFKICQLNIFKIIDSVFVPSDDFVQFSALYAFQSFFNHKKDCNMSVFHFVKGIRFVKARRDIKEGEELFFDYFDSEEDHD